MSTLETDKPGVEALLAKLQTNGLTINPSYLGQDTYPTTLTTQLRAGTAADTFGVLPGNGNNWCVEALGPSGYLADLSDEPWVAGLPASVVAPVSYQGHVQILPISGGVFPVYYNKSVFEKAGVTPPTTWTELLDICKKLKSAGVTPIALGNGELGVGSIFLTYQLAATLNYRTDPDWAKKRLDKSVTFANSGWVQVFEKLQELQSNDVFNKSINGTSLDQALGMVATGKAAMVGAVAQQLGAIEAAGKPGAYGSFALPATDSADDTWIAAGSGMGYAVNAKGQGRAASMGVLRKMAKPENVAAFNKAIGGIPLLPATADAVPATLTPMLPYVKDNRTATYMDQLWPNGDVQAALFKGTQSFLGGDASIDDVLKGMDVAFDK
jgi:raffinose/stachyose/melibiose transport system substrate-binding protein